MRERYMNRKCAIAADPWATCIAHESAWYMKVICHLYMSSHGLWVNVEDPCLKCSVTLSTLQIFVCTSTYTQICGVFQGRVASTLCSSSQCILVKVDWKPCVKGGRAPAVDKWAVKPRGRALWLAGSASPFNINNIQIKTVTSLYIKQDRTRQRVQQVV